MFPNLIIILKSQSVSVGFNADFLRSLCQWVVLSKDIHGIACEVGHVLSNHEGDMAKFVFFIEDDVILHHSIGPLVIFGISQHILSTHKHSNGNICDFFNRDERRVLVSVNFLVSIAAIVKGLELGGVDDLSIVNDGPQAGA